MIKQPEYLRRRQQLMRMTGEGGIIILSAAKEVIRNNDVFYPYRQDSDFLYLTGFREPEALLVLIPEGRYGRSILFCREKDPARERWDGPMVGLEQAVSDYGMDEAYPYTEINKCLPDLLNDKERIYYDLGKQADFDHQLISWLNDFRGKTHKDIHAPDEIVALDHLLHDMRLYKSRSELAVMNQSAKVAANAHRAAMKRCQPGVNEAEVQAELVKIFLENQCEASYLPIVAGGNNACTLHYIQNNQTLNDGDLLLIDAGAEYDGYASDITRTFPVNGQFTAEQKALYEVVLTAQLYAIDYARAGWQWDDVHEAAVLKAAEGMIELGVLKGSLDEILGKEHYKRYYVHNTGHWLGLDVHDVGDYQIDGESRELEPGMVFTVEPGIYIPEDDTRVAKRWRGIGIRIEDNVVVTRDEPRILSKSVPKTVEDIEHLMAS